MASSATRSIAAGEVLEDPSPNLDLLDYGSSGDDNPVLARSLRLSLEPVSSGKSSSSGTILCSSQLVASSPAGDGCRVLQVSPFSNAACSPHAAHTCSPMLTSSRAGNPAQIRLLSRLSDEVIVKESLPTILFVASATEVGEGSNVGRAVGQAFAGSSPLLAKPKRANQSSTWVQTSRLATFNR